MDFIMEVCGAMLLVAAALTALSLASIFAYASVAIIKAIIQDRKKHKRSKKSKRKGGKA